MSNRRLRNRLAQILGGEASVTNGVIQVARLRSFPATILGRRTRSPIVFPQLFTFENPDRRGRTLNLGESVVLQIEANRLISTLRRQGITVTALHNHWLFENPRLMYIHWESIENPITFARKSARALRLLRR